MNTMEKMQQS